MQLLILTDSILENFAKFTAKHLHQSLLLKKTLALVFSCEFCKIFKKHFFYRTHPDDCFWKIKEHSPEKIPDSFYFLI